MVIADDLYATRTMEAASHHSAISESDALIESIASVVV